MQIDYDELAARVKSLEIVFNAGQGKNFIYDKLMNKLGKEVSWENLVLTKFVVVQKSERIAENAYLHAFFEKAKL